jgi:hypothetical protein
VVWSFVYLAVQSLFALMLLFGRSDRSKELEILVLRHEVALLRRRSSRQPIERADRALLATLSQALPRRAWAAFSVRPETVLRCHRQLVARRWTYPHSKPGRPPLERPRRELIVRPRARTRTGVIIASPASSSSSTLRSPQQLCEKCSPPLAFHEHRRGRENRGDRSCANKPPARSLAISLRSKRSACSGSTCSSCSRLRRANRVRRVHT